MQYSFAAVFLPLVLAAPFPQADDYDFSPSGIDSAAPLSMPTSFVPTATATTRLDPGGSLPVNPTAGTAAPSGHGVFFGTKGAQNPPYAFPSPSSSSSSSSCKSGVNAYPTGFATGTAGAASGIIPTPSGRGNGNGNEKRSAGDVLPYWSTLAVSMISSTTSAVTATATATTASHGHRNGDWNEKRSAGDVLPFWSTVAVSMTPAADVTAAAATATTGTGAGTGAGVGADVQDGKGRQGASFGDHSMSVDFTAGQSGLPTERPSGLPTGMPSGTPGFGHALDGKSGEQEDVEHHGGAGMSGGGSGNARSSGAEKTAMPTATAVA